ncbi:hypothetical protein L873DRAFT_665712 [Choiromyces venosus 120613-1]|uniref:RNA polymerase II assembly factor Rtp1 C-terminal domain-containing protein n=1 Tax=Choiromyces venosus 120613-1 TaxID=1336337 RepID=A0A3N4J640_9PEZI|nr:hypothetical protein L873DRAFT_665712 [Choiromyces venosus 120613-1]
MTSSAISQATHLLSPVLDKTKPKPLGQSLLQQLSQTLPTPLPITADEKSTAVAVVTHALTLLTLHKSEAQARTSTNSTGQQLVSPAEVRVVVCLLDLVVLEGIYPSLTRGVGIPIERRARSASLPGFATGRGKKRIEEVQDRKDVGLLKLVVGRLLELLGGDDDNVAKGDLLRRAGDRVLVDVIAGCAELAFNPENGDTGEWKERFRVLIDGTPTPQLLPLLLQLLTPQTPTFFRNPLAKTLSLIPFKRPHAVRHIIELFLSTDTPADSSSSAPSNLSIEALSKASKIICAVPSSVDAGEYFSKVCVELLELLDSEDVLMVRAAGFVIADVLGRKGRGIEETVERVLVVPLISNLDPGVLAWVKGEVTPKKVEEEGKKEERKSSSALLAFEDSPAPPKSTIPEIPSRRPLVAEVEDGTDEDLSIKPLVPETELSNALRHLEILLSSQPSPTLPQRLIAPIVLPLWALMNFAKSTGRRTWYERALSLLKTYIKTSPDESVLQKIQGDILYSGGETWEFGPGSEGGIEIRYWTGGTSGFDVGKTEARVQEFLGLLEDGGVSGAVLNDFFLGILRTWLGRRNTESEDPVKMFTTLKILQEVLGRHEETLAKNPTQILQIVKEVLDEYVEYQESLNSARKDTSTPSLGGLGNIVSNPPPPRLKGGGDDDEELDEETERIQTLTMTLSLLSVIVSNPTTKLTPTDERLLQTLHPALTYITTSRSTNPEIKTLALNITSLLTLHSPTSSSTTTSTPSSLLTRQKETYTLAISYLHDPLIPVRAHGLHLLRELILAASPVINVQSTMAQLIDLLKDNDSFVYLNVVKCLSALTERHSRTVTGMLVEAYLDDGEGEGGGKLGLDERLRLGEALLFTVQRLGGALVGDTARVVGEGMISVVSRRRIHITSKPAGEEWDPEAEPEDEDESEEITAYATHLLTSWPPNPTENTEDLRIRTSALSILGAAIETNPTGLGQDIIINALDVCMSVLTLETKVEKGILRRAAVVCVCGVLKGLVGADEDGQEGWREAVWEVLRGRIGEVRRVVGYLAGTDLDGLVREQARVVLESLEGVVGVWVGRGAATAGGGLVNGMGERGLRVL